MSDGEGSWRDHQFAELIGYPVEIVMTCGCTKVTVGPPAYFMSRLGDQATPRDAARRMICQTCQQRPSLRLQRTWSVSARPDLPDWMGL